MRSVPDKVKTGAEGVLQLHMLVIRYSHGRSFLFRHLSVLIQENVSIMLINAFGDGFGVRFEFMKGPRTLHCFDFRDTPLATCGRCGCRKDWGRRAGV